MSGLFKGVKKIFKKVGNFVKKVGIPLLAAGAIVFTAGAALGLAPLAGGFGGAVSAALGSVGISGTGVIGGALTGAITQAGYGAAIGGISSAAMGGGFTEGATKGALAGAVTGGFMGATGLGPTDPLKGIGGGEAAPAGNVTMSSRNGLGGTPLARPAMSTAAPVSGPASAVAAPVASAPVAAAPAGFGSATQAASSGFGALMNSPFMSNPVVAQTIAGGINGVITGMGKDDRDPDAFNREDQARVTASYDVGPSAYDSMSSVDSTPRPTPAQKWSRPRARYDRDQRRVVYE